MLRIIYPLLFILLLISCKKTIDQPRKEAPRLVRTQVDYGDGTGLYSNFIEYNAAGRMTRVTRTFRGDSIGLTYDITYSENEVVIKHSISDYISLIVRYTLDAGHKPLKRTKYSVEQFNNRPSLQFYHLYTDTTYFTYDSENLLLTKESKQYDSVQQNLGVEEIYVHAKAIKEDYVNANKNVSEIKQEINSRYRIDAYHSTPFKGNSKFSFSYSSSQVNKVDEENAFLYEEFDILTSIYSSFNSSYRNIPNKIIISGTINDFAEPSISYNSDGFVTKIDEKTPNQTIKRYFFYSH
jgi:hypothetical protein